GEGTVALPLVGHPRWREVGRCPRLCSAAEDRRAEGGDHTQEDDRTGKAHRPCNQQVKLSLRAGPDGSPESSTRRARIFLTALGPGCSWSWARPSSSSQPSSCTRSGSCPRSS